MSGMEPNTSPALCIPWCRGSLITLESAPPYPFPKEGAFTQAPQQSKKTWKVREGGAQGPWLALCVWRNSVREMVLPQGSKENTTSATTRPNVAESRPLRVLVSLLRTLNPSYLHWLMGALTSLAFTVSAPAGGAPCPSSP